MTYPLNGNVVDKCLHIKKLLETNARGLGLQAVYYGDQVKIMATPTACIEPSEKRNSQKQAAGGRMIDNTLEIQVILYHSVVQSTQVTRQEVDEFAQAVEDLINEDRLMIEDGQPTVINSYVSLVQSGYMDRSSATMRGTRLTVSITTRTMLPS